MMPAAHAAHWVVTYTSTLNGTAYATNSPTPPSLNGSGSGPFTLVVTVTLTWTPDSPQDMTPPPATVSYIETASAGVHAVDTLNPPQKGLVNEKDAASDGLGDMPVEDSPRPPDYGASSSGSLLGQKAGAKTVALDTRTLNLSLSYDPGSDAANGGYCLSYSVAVTTINLSITLTGTTPDSSGAPNILVGQGCTAGLVPTGCTINSYQWYVSGTTFQDWEPTTPAMPNATPPTQANPNASYESDGTGPLTNSTAHWFWNDLQQTSETVKCTANVTPTGQSPMQVLVSMQVIVQVPTSTAFAVGGYMQVNMANPNDKTHNNLWAGPTTYEKNIDKFPAGMNWQAGVTTPPTPAFGTGKLELVQIVSTNNSVTTVAHPTVTVPDPNNKYPMSLDGTYPYGDVVSEMPAPAIPINDNHSPGARLDGATLLASANKGGSYYDYLMYMPPVATGSTSMWVLLSTFNWTANESASIPTGNNWSLYASQHGGSDYAGAVSPPGSNPPQNSAPTPVPFTLATVPNTFPKWTHIDPKQ